MCAGNGNEKADKAKGDARHCDQGKKLDELKGGTFSQSLDEVTNLNTTKGCICYYNNDSESLTNVNDMAECRCTCRIKPKISD